MSDVVFVNVYEYNYLGTRCLASYLRSKGVSTHNILYENRVMRAVPEASDGEVCGYRMYFNGQIVEQPTLRVPLSPADSDTIAKLIKTHKPKIVGFSARSTFNYLAKSMAEAFRKACPDALLVAGGYGPTLEPDFYLDAGFDVVIRGDGEDALLELTRAWDTPDKAPMLKIANTVWSEKWGGARNGLRDQVKDISQYPAPLSGHEYFSYIEDGKVYENTDPVLLWDFHDTFFGRGCTGKCSYCSGGQWAHLYRQEGKKAYKRRNREIGDVIKELAALPPHIDFIAFSDEYWGHSRKVTYEFFKEYKEKINKPFFAYLSYDQFVENPELAQLILEAGFASTGIGFQSGSPGFLRTYYDRSPNYNVMLKYANILFENKVFIRPQFIGGNCYETMDDLASTLDVIRKLPFSIESPYSVQLQNLQLKPHPCSKLREIAPKVVTDPMPVDEWLYRAILMDMARFVSEDELNEFMSRQDLRSDLKSLQKLHDRILFQKQFDHFTQLVETGRGKPWIFYGAGQAFNRNKNFFAPLGAEAILLDDKYRGYLREVDGIPVFSPAEYFAANSTEDVNCLIFSTTPWFIARRLLRNFNMPSANIHSCSSDWSSPFAADLAPELDT